MMDSRISIPDEAAKYILYQRTKYIQFSRNFFYRTFRKLIPFLSYNRLVAMEAALRKQQIKQLYSEDMLSEYLTLKPHLPAQCRCVLDIGCGVAGIDVFLAQHYAGKPIDFYLLDKSRVEKKIYYKLKDKGAFYNSLDIAKKLLQANGVEQNRIHLIEANDHNTIEIDPPMDLILSLISWGFHYPVETYLEQAHQRLSPGGYLILDVRKNSDGRALLAQKFKRTDVIFEGDKFERVRAIK